MKKTSPTCHSRDGSSRRLCGNLGLWIPDKVGNDNKKGGFLASEMCIVVALALLLFGGTVYFFLQGTPLSRDSRRVSDLAQLSRALALYLDAEGRYPNGCEWSTETCWKDFLGLYIKKVPTDPLNERAGACKSEANCPIYRYCLLQGGRVFILAANLEKPKKTLAGDNPACSLGGPNQYWVTN